jgi:hypothetical protein
MFGFLSPSPAKAFLAGFVLGIVAAVAVVALVM